MVDEDILLETIKELRLKIEEFTSELDGLKITKLKLENNKMDYENIFNIMKHFKIAFEGANETDQIRIVHDLVKEIKINPSNDINKRTVNEIELMGINNTNPKDFEVTYDKVHLSLF